MTTYPITMDISDDQRTSLLLQLDPTYTPPPEPPVLPNLLYANGDSMFYAVRPGVTLAQSAIQQIGVARGFATIINAAVPGNSSLEMRSHMAADLVANPPGAVAIQQSANNQAKGVTIAQSRQANLDMINMGRDTGASVTFFSHNIFIHDGGTYLHGYGMDEYAMIKEITSDPDIQLVDVMDYHMRALFLLGFNGQLTANSNPIIKPMFTLDGAGNPDWIHLSAPWQKLYVEPCLMNPRACALPL